MQPTTAILLMAYGGPDSLDDVAPYLADIRHGRPTSPELIKEIAARYAAIGGKSPLLAITRLQAKRLEKELNNQGDRKFEVFVGMRHWHPYIRDVVETIHSAKIFKIIALCMTPFSSRMTTGAYFEKLESAIKDIYSGAQPEVNYVGPWFKHPKYIQALAQNIKQGLGRFNGYPQAQVPVVFTAHSLPSALAEQGDPYHEQFAELANRVARAAGVTEGQWTAGYQSAGASGERWLGPSLKEMIALLAKNGHKSVLIAPIGFLTDHVEILYDVDIEVKQYANQLGIKLERTPSLNTDKELINAWAQMIIEEKFCG